MKTRNRLAAVTASTLTGASVFVLAAPSHDGNREFRRSAARSNVLRMPATVTPISAASRHISDDGPDYDGPDYDDAC